MPGGSEYLGPPDSLRHYSEVVIEAGLKVKGAKNPYTSLNGHMFSFLTKEGVMALRLSDQDQSAFLEKYDSGPVEQYGSVMRGYVSVPDEVLMNAEIVGEWFEKSREWIGSLEPKSTK